MAVVGSNIINTIDVAQRLPLMKSKDDAKQFFHRVGFHSVYVPSNLGGRLQIAFADGATKDATKRIGVLDPHDVTHLPGEGGVIRIDIEPRMRGHGVFQFAVFDESRDYWLYALFEESGMARQADGKPLIPWNFWYFPFADAKKDQSAWGGTELQPLQKYERAFGETGVLDWEIEHHGDPRKDLPPWEGHCHLAAPASVMFFNPMPEGFEYNGEQFFAEELKLFAAEFVGRFGQVTEVYALPGETSRRDGPFHERKPSELPERFGSEPKALIALLNVVRQHLGVLKSPLVMDLRDTLGDEHAAVWNHAVYSYRTQYWQPDVADPTLTEGSCTVFANADIYSGRTSSGFPATVSTKKHGAELEHSGDHTRRRSEFALRFTSAGYYDPNAAENRWHRTSSEFADTFAPRYATSIGKPSKTAIAQFGNPRLTAKRVLQLVKLRPEFE